MSKECAHLPSTIDLESREFTDDLMRELNQDTWKDQRDEMKIKEGKIIMRANFTCEIRTLASLEVTSSICTHSHIQSMANLSWLRTPSVEWERSTKTYLMSWQSEDQHSWSVSVKCWSSKLVRPLNVTIWWEWLMKWVKLKIANVRLEIEKILFD